MFGPTRKSSVTAVSAARVIVPPLAVVCTAGGVTRLLLLFNNINAPEESRWSGRLRAFSGSFDRSAGGGVAASSASVGTMKLTTNEKKNGPLTPLNLRRTT